MRFIYLLFTLLVSVSLITAQSSQSYLGITSNKVHPKKADRLGFDQAYGSYITKVSKGTAAEKAGLQPFDYVTQVGDVALSSETSLGNALSNYNAGEVTTVSFIRNGQAMVRNVALGSISDRNHDNRPDDEDPFLGVHESHNRVDGVDGVPVNIASNTTADYIGMEDGDIITQIDNYPVLDWHDMTAAIDNRMPGDNIAVTVWRDGEEVTMEGRIKSEEHDAPIDRMIDMEYMEVSYQDMEKEEMEQVEELLEEDISEMPELMVTDLKLFPNPNIGQFNLTFEVPGEGDVFIMVYSSQGELIINEQISDFSGRFNESYDLGVNPAGTYYLMVRQGENVMSRKIIVARS